MTFSILTLYTLPKKNNHFSKNIKISKKNFLKYNSNPKIIKKFFNI